MRLSDLWRESRRRVDEALDQFLPPATGDPLGCPARLAEAMRYSMLAGGKRLRPVLCLLATEACGGDVADALPAACALEMVHTYSLIHDDLPAMDDDDLRRGRPTCHKAFDEATAILAGDGLLTLAFELIAATCAGACRRRVRADFGGSRRAARDGRRPDGRPPGRRAATDATVAELESIHRRKTGALLSAPSLRMGAASPPRLRQSREALAIYGRAVGLAFQIVDDLLDVQGDEAKLGKRVNKDSGLGKWTYPGLLGRRRQPRKARQLADEARGGAGSAGRPGRRLAGAGRWTFWKGTVDEQHDVAQDPVAGRLAGHSPRRSWSGWPPRCASELIGVVGLRAAHFASNLGVVELCLALHLTFDFTQRPPDLGHRPPDLSPQADHRPRRRAAHDPHQGGPDGLPEPGRERVRPVHDRATPAALRRRRWA